MCALVNAATNSLIALRTLVSAEIHRYAERPQLPRPGHLSSAGRVWDPGHARASQQAAATSAARGAEVFSDSRLNRQEASAGGCELCGLA
jgi:hypothetical protein